MIFWILILASVFGVLTAADAVIKEYQRRRRARKEWNEFNNTKDL